MNVTRPSTAGRPDASPRLMPSACDPPAAVVPPSAGSTLAPPMVAAASAHWLRPTSQATSTFASLFTAKLWNPKIPGRRQPRLPVK